MAGQFTEAQVERIQAEIREKYRTVADGPAGYFRYPVGAEGLSGLGYDPSLTDRLPPEVAGSYCGVGNPFSLGEIPEGASVLDIGCGAGVDTLLAAMLAGDGGKALGIDVTAEMVARAEQSRKAAGISNAEFREARVQDLDPGDGVFDVVISNGVFNLIPEKEEALAAVFALLKPGGKLFIADQFAKGASSRDPEEKVRTWFQ